MVNIFKEFEPIFYPKSVAVVGVSASEEKAGNQFLSAMLTFGFKGRLYPINPNSRSILGLQTYSSVKDIPEPVDLVYISTPASTTPKIIEDCVAKGVPAAVVFSAGFRELDEDGRRLEQEIVALAKNKLRIVGPNCFGVYCPRGNITLLPGAKYPKESGEVALLAQSGGLVTHIVSTAGKYGIRFSKAISYGNACDLNEADLLEYLTFDPETKIIAAYIEGAKDGRRFLKLARNLAGRKPLVVWKGGLTQSGKKAVHSHTASLGGEKTAWASFFKQTGAIPVESVEELLDTTILFSQNTQRVGPRVAVVGGGGAVGVAASDSCEKVGLRIPTSSPDIINQLKTISPPAGSSLKNPFDVGHPYPPASVFQKTLEAILSWNEIDALIIERIFLHDTRAITGAFDADMGKRVQVILDAKRKFNKPILAVLEEMTTDADTANIEISKIKTRSNLLKSGVSVFPTLDRAVKALSNICAYYENSSRLH